MKRLTKHRILAAVLVVAMLLPMIPVGSFPVFAVGQDLEVTNPFTPETPIEIDGETVYSKSYRIPSMVTLADGTIVAAADIRWNTTYDGGGLDTLVARSTNGGKTWAYTLANYLGDNGNEYNPLSTSFIDSSLLVAADGQTLFMLCDLYAGGVALNGNGVQDFPSTKTGFNENGYLMLYKGFSSPTPDHYLKDGKIYSNDGTLQEGYMVDGYFNVYQNGNYVGNLFFYESPFRAVSTGYLYLTKSEDGGKTWSEPALLNLKTSSEQVCLVTPGDALTTSSGIMVFPVYSYNGLETSQKLGFIYSADNGVTWQRSENFTGAVTFSSESSVIELSNGTLRFFYRNKNSVLSYVDYDLANGKWGAEQKTTVPINSNTELSAVSYPKTTIDGKQVILVSCPTGPNSAGSTSSDGTCRVNGKMFAFVVDPDTGAMELKDTIDVSGTNSAQLSGSEYTDKQGFFAYSNITVRADGSILLMYENNQYGWGSGDGKYYTMTLKAFGIDELEDKIEFEKELVIDPSVSVTVNGEAVTEVTVSTDEKVNLDAAADFPTPDIDYRWQIEYEDGKWVDIYGENEDALSLSYGMVASLADENDTVRVRCVSTAGTRSCVSNPITVTLDSIVGGTDIDPTAEIQIDGISAESITTTYGNDSFVVKLNATTNLTGMLSYYWEVLSDAENNDWTEISAGPSCTVRYADLDFDRYDSTSDVSFVQLTVTNGNLSATDIFAVYRITEVTVSNSSGTANGTVDVTVSGKLPEDATLNLTDASGTQIGGVNASEIALALDVSITQNGSQWQPSAGETVRVSIPAAQLGLQDGDCFTVYHIHDGVTELLGPFVVINGYATFDIDGFSVVVISTNYGASIGATTELSQQLLLLYPEPNSLSSTMAFYTDLPEKLIITDYYFDSDNARLLYKIDAAPGYTWPEAFANVHWCESSDLTNINVNGTAGVFDANGNPVDDAAVSTSAGVVVSAITSLQSADITYKWQICYDTENDLWVNISGENDADITIVAGMVMSLMDENNQVKVRCVTSAGSKTVITEPIIITLTEAQPGNDTVDILIDSEVAENVNISGSDLASFNSTLSASTTLTGDLTYSWEVLFDKYYDMWWLQGQSATFNPVFDPYKDGVYLDSNFIHAVDDTTSEVCIRLTVSNGTTTVRNTFVINVNSEETAAVASYGLARGRMGAYAANSGIATVDDNTTIYKIVINYLYYHNMATAASPYTSTVGSSTQITDPVEFPTVLGYLPYVMDEDGNLVHMDSYEFSGLLTEDFELTVYYKPTTVSYTINIYTQNAEDDNYQLLMTRTGAALTGTVIDTISMPLSGYYQTRMTTTTASVAADGSTVFNLYYDRIYYLMKFDLDGGYGVQPIYARHGVKLDIPSPVKAGYTFVGWDNTTTGTGDGIADTLPTTMPIGNTSYAAIWETVDNAKVTIVYWGENANDEGYSYLESQEIYAKPGTQLTFGSNQLVCTLEEHTHNNCEVNCGKTEHTHSQANGCTLSCGHTHTHTKNCFTNASGNNNGDVTDNDRAAITAIGDGEPQSGYVYNIKVSYDSRYYMYLYWEGNWYRLSQAYSINTDYIEGEALGTGTYTTRYGTMYTATKYKARASRCTDDHTHSSECYTCDKEAHTHTANCYNCIEHKHNDDCYLKTDSQDTDLWTYVRSDTVTVAADGSTVMNVYFDRTTFEMHFRAKNSNLDTYGVIEDKWGANIEEEFYAICEKAGYNSWSENRDASSPWTNHLEIMPQEDRVYYSYTGSGNNIWVMTYYKESFTPGVYEVAFTVELHRSGTTTVSKEEFIELEGFDFNEDKSTKTGSSTNGAKFYYDRTKYILEFHNGEEIVKTATVPYQANLGSYAFTPTAPSFYEAGSVQFAGWYQNPECTGDEVKLDQTTMPSSNKILYAKWIPVSHDVTIYRYKNADGTFPSGKDIIQETIQVPHGSFLQQQYIPEDPEYSPYIFVDWFYMDGNTEKAFDFINIPVTKDLQIYAKWSSDVQLPYTIKYVDKVTGMEIADRETGKQFAGETLTFQAKTGSNLKEGYQTGYYPTVPSHSIEFVIQDGVTSYEYIFEYVSKESVPYTVYYLSKTEGTVNYGTKEYNGETCYKILADKTVNSTNAIVTENFVQVAGYMPNAYQQSLVLSGADDAVNEIYFIYTVDTTHAYYKVSHYTQNLDGSWYEYSSYESVGVIGSIYTEGARTITGFTYDPSIRGTLTTGTLTAEGLHLQLYYTRNKYPYKVEYRVEGTGTLLDAESFTTEELMQYYNQTISVSPNRTFNGYHLVSNSPIAHIIQIEQDTNMQNPVANVIIFYYAEDEVTINYVVVGPSGCGTVTPTSQTVQVLSGNPMSTADASSAVYKFVGWYSDEACTELITESRVISPEKVNDLNVAATYYAKFEYNLTSLTIHKAFPSGADYSMDVNQSFLFDVVEVDEQGNVVSNGVSLTVTVHGNGFITIDGLTVGQRYKITEKTDWSWRYGQCTPSSDLANSPVSDNSIIVMLTADAAANQVTFTNTRDNDQWLDGDSWCNNIFK